MFYNIPITTTVPKSVKKTTSPRELKQTKSYGSWNFSTYKEANSFAWDKTFAYPENSYTPRKQGNLWCVTEVPRPKEEKVKPLF